MAAVACLQGLEKGAMGTLPERGTDAGYSKPENKVLSNRAVPKI